MKAEEDLRGFARFATAEEGCLGSLVADEPAARHFIAAFDPQPLHTDAAGHPILSNWHVACLLMRLIADGLLNSTKSMGSGAVRDLDWLKPVRMGAPLTGYYQVTSTRLSSRGDRGYVDMDFLLRDGTNDPVLTMKSTVIMGV